MRTSDPMSGIDRTNCDTLGYGDFYGTYERRFDIPQFSVALVGPDDIWMNGRRHNHDTTHMVFVLGDDYVLSAGGRQQTLRPESLVFVPAGTTHSNHPATPRTRILTISVPASQVEQASDYVRLPETESAFRQGQIAFLATRLETECDRWTDASPLIATGLCYELLGAVAQRAVVQEHRPPRWLDAARSMLRDRCTEAVSIAEIAAEVQVHPIHLSRTFRKFFGCTPGDYLRGCRVERAAALLRAEHSSIADVALQCGFSDQSHFSRVFRRLLGVTPAAFRLRHAGKV